MLNPTIPLSSTLFPHTAMSILMNSTLVVPHLYLWALRPYGNSNAKINTHSFWKPFRQLFMESRIVERNCTLKQARDVKCMKMEHIFDLSPILNLFGKRNARLISTSDFFQEMGLQDYYLHTQGISDASIEANAWNMLEQEANILYLEDNQRHSYRFYDSSTSISQDAEINEQEADANQMPDSSRATLEFSYDNIDLQFFKTNETIMEFMKKTRSGNLRHSQIVYHQAQHSRYYNINKKKQVTPMIFQVINLRRVGITRHSPPDPHKSFLNSAIY